MKTVFVLIPIKVRINDDGDVNCAQMPTHTLATEMYKARGCYSTLEDASDALCDVPYAPLREVPDDKS